MLIHFRKPLDWEHAYLHFWSAGHHRGEAQWPGLPMTPSTGRWCDLEIPVDDTTGCWASMVFNDGDSRQTADAVCGIHEAWYSDGQLWDHNPDIYKHFVFPNGATKALVLSFDDGNIQDKLLLSIFRDNGLTGTFHVNSGLTFHHDKVPLESLAKVYDGHEVSAHSVTHPYLDSIEDRQLLRKEVEDDRVRLERACSRPVRGISYPFGAYTPKLIEHLPEWGFTYGRTVENTDAFHLPSDLYRWRPTGHHHAAMPLAQRFVASPGEDLQMLFIWGHSWELDGNQPSNNWHEILNVCTFLGCQADIWSAGAADVADYLLAIRQVSLASASGDAGRIHNPSDRTLYLRDSDKVIELRPGQSVNRLQPAKIADIRAISWPNHAHCGVQT